MNALPHSLDPWSRWTLGGQKRRVEMQRPDLRGELGIQISTANIRTQRVRELPVMQCRDDEMVTIFQHSCLPAARRLGKGLRNVLSNGYARV